MLVFWLRLRRRGCLVRNVFGSVFNLCGFWRRLGVMLRMSVGIFRVLVGKGG